MPSDNPRAFLDARRWNTVECFDDRDGALERARTFRRKNAFGAGRAYRVVEGRDGKWCIEHASGLSQREREHGAYYNRKMLESESGQRKLDM